MRLLWTAKLRLVLIGMMFTKGNKMFDNLNNIKLEKEIGQLFLEILQKEDPNAALAGGALRNWDEGESCNDFDYFMNMPSHMSLGQMRKKLEVICGRSVSILSDEAYLFSTEAKKAISGVFEVQLLSKTVQIIVLNNMRVGEYIFKHFPVSNSQIWSYDCKNLGVIKSDLYDYGKKYNCIFVSKDISATYYEKIKSYYPNKTMLFST